MLQRLAQQLPDIVRLHETASGVSARFTSNSAKYGIRSHHPLTATEHLAITEALLAPVRADATHPNRTWPAAAVRDYGARAAALHAALGGALPRLLNKRPDFVALCHRTGLLEAIYAAWPKGVPTGRTAADAHYLDTEGVAPQSHREWLAWLHWAAVNRGRTDWADALAETVRLPWRTAWSRWRPYGVFGKHPGTSGIVDYVELGLSDDVPVVTTQRELPLPAGGRFGGTRRRAVSGTGMASDGRHRARRPVRRRYLPRFRRRGRPRGGPYGRHPAARFPAPGGPAPSAAAQRPGCGAGRRRSLGAGWERRRLRCGHP